MQYWKSIALASKNEHETKQLTDLAPFRVFLVRKAVVKPGAFIEDIPSQEDQSFEEISDYLKTFSKSIKENENMSLKNKVLMGGWISTAARAFRCNKNTLGENLPSRFEDGMYRECGLKKQTIYNYKNLYKLMRLAPKLLNRRVNMTFLLKTTRFF